MISDKHSLMAGGVLGSWEMRLIENRGHYILHCRFSACL